MSVFGDFRRVWVKRFPNSDLPAAWEEDVRANLAKHKQKVAVLREELEKEEFYVEYLERLLEDVAQSKAANVGPETAPPEVLSTTQTGNHSDDSVGNREAGRGPGPVDTPERPDDNSDEFEARISKSGSKDSINQCISELSIGLTSSPVTTSEKNTPIKAAASLRLNEARELEEHQVQEEALISDPSNYITVIEVNCLDGKKSKESVPLRKVCLPLYLVFMEMTHVCQVDSIILGISHDYCN